MGRKQLLLLACAGGLIMAGLVRADEKLDALLARFRQAAAGAKTMSADMVLSFQAGEQKQTMNATIRLMKPNMARVRMSEPGPGAFSTLITDGKNTFVVLEQQKQYLKLPDGGFPMEQLFPPVAAFLNPDRFFDGTDPKHAGTASVEGQTYEVMEYTSSLPPGKAKAYFGASGLLEGAEITFKAGPGTVTQKTWLKNLKPAAPVKPEEFVYKPAPGFKQFQPPRQPSYEKNLLPVGKAAPDFLLPQPGGGQLALSEARKGKKAVLVNFWFHGWGACRAEFPHLQKIYDELKEKGLELIAVNSGDPEERIQQYVSENKFTFRIVMGGQGEKYTVGKAYGVQAYPTNYLLDADGKVVWRAVGFDEDGLRAALAKMGLK